MDMEKYGVDMESMPPTDEQLRKIKAMNPEAKLPEGFKEASEMIAELEKKG